MKKIFTLAVAAFTICTMNMAAVTLPHTEGFEQSEGFAADFNVIGQTNWGANNGYTGAFWNTIFAGNPAANRPYTASIATPGAESSSQCLKIVIEKELFSPDNSPKRTQIRLRTAAGTFVKGEEYQVTFWAKVDGETALPVINNCNPIGTEWTEFTINNAKPLNNDGQIALDILPSNSDYATSTNYTLYIDNLTFAEQEEEGGGDEVVPGTLTLPYEDGFESGDGFASSFTAIGPAVWNETEENPYTGEFWFNTFASTDSINKAYTTSIVTEKAYGGNQALKIEISAKVFTPKTGSEKLGAIRIKSETRLLDDGAQDVIVDFWAKVDGEKALKVIKDGLDTLEIGTAWVKHTMKAPVNKTNGANLGGAFSIDFLALSTTDFTTANDYTIYIDDLRLYKQGTGTDNIKIEKNELSFYCTNKVVYFENTSGALIFL